MLFHFVVTLSSFSENKTTWEITQTLHYSIIFNCICRIYIYKTPTAAQVRSLENFTKNEEYPQIYQGMDGARAFILKVAQCWLSVSFRGSCCFKHWRLAAHTLWSCLLASTSHNLTRTSNLFVSFKPAGGDSPPWRTLTSFGVFLVEFV